MILRAAAALPHRDRQRATEALRQQLQVMAAAGDVTPDWSTLAVAGPTERADADPEARFEWAAVVSAQATAAADPRPAVAAGVAGRSEADRRRDRCT